MKILLSLLILLQSISTYAGQAELIKLDDDFVGEQEINKTIYVPQKDRSQYEIHINSQGLVLDTNGDKLDTRLLPGGTAMFVYSKEGKIYISKRQKRLKFHHSSLVGGDDVIVAGYIKVTRGHIMLLSDISPMYVAKSKGNLKAAIYRLKVMGADLNDLSALFSVNM